MSSDKSSINGLEEKSIKILKAKKKRKKNSNLKIFGKRELK